MKHQKLVLLFILLLGIASTIVYGKLFKDDEVKNVFDEIYFSGAPKDLNYHLAKSTASMVDTGCIKYREEEHVAGFSGSIDEEFNQSCKLDAMESASLSYFYNKAQLSINIILKPTDALSDSSIFFMTYNTVDHHIVIDYRHNYLNDEDDSMQVDTYGSGKISDDFYQRHNTSRAELVKKADELLSQYLLPLYFDKNKENGNQSRFSMENLGEYTIEYHF